MTKRLPTRGQHHQSSNRKAQPPKALGSGALPGIMHHPRALPQGDARRRPARDRSPVGRLRDLEVIDASDVLHDTHAGIVPGGAFCFGVLRFALLRTPLPKRHSRNLLRGRKVAETAS
jgi:hypothetical protein